MTQKLDRIINKYIPLFDSQGPWQVHYLLRQRCWGDCCHKFGTRMEAFFKEKFLFMILTIALYNSIALFFKRRHFLFSFVVKNNLFPECWLRLLVLLIENEWDSSNNKKKALIFFFNSGWFLSKSVYIIKLEFFLTRFQNIFSGI